MFFIKSFDLKVMYFILFIGYLLSTFFNPQYVGCAIMLLSLIGVYVIQIGMDNTIHSDNSYKTVLLTMMCSSSIFTFYTIYLILQTNIDILNKKDEFAHIRYMIQIILFIQLFIFFILNYFKKATYRLILNSIEVLISIINLYMIYNLRRKIQNFMTDDCNKSCVLSDTVKI
jgi:Na+/H+-translocating membrane pyrophosphatase